MADVTIYFSADAAAEEDSSVETPLSPRAKMLVIAGLALAAWVPVLLPLCLIFHR
jgi:hypothetical protein